VSRGLGSIQRALLFALARIEVAAAEDAAQRQQQYLPPTCARIWQVLDVAYEHALRNAHERSLKRIREHEAAHRAGDVDVFDRLLMIGLKKIDLNRPPTRDQLAELYNPSRALDTLHRRGLVATCHPILSLAHGVALRAAGLVEARRLGLPDSAIVDFDRLTGQLAEVAQWRFDGVVAAPAVIR
jgi:hypothetical protein